MEQPRARRGRPAENAPGASRHIISPVTRARILSNAAAAGRYKKSRRKNREYCHIRAHEKPSDKMWFLKIILAGVDYQNKIRCKQAGTTLSTSRSRRRARQSALRGGARYAACNSLRLSRIRGDSSARNEICHISSLGCL